MKWMITGGCGFIGTSLIRRLIAEGGHSVRVVDNFSVGMREDLATVCGFCEVTDLGVFPKNGVELVEGDVLDDQLAVQASRGADVIVHLAANTGVGPSVENPRKDCVTNVIGTFNYLEGARINGVRRFVFASSGAPIGECDPPIHEEKAPHPVSPYGASKLAGEGYCSAYFRTFRIETVALRFGNVYGPGSGHKSSVVAKFIKQALAGEPLEIYGDGKQTRDFIFIEDVVSAIFLSTTTNGVGGEVFQIASNRETTVREMVELLMRIFTEAELNNVPLIYGEKRLGDVTRNFSDTSKAKNKLGWQCGKDLPNGLASTVASFIKSQDCL